MKAQTKVDIITYGAIALLLLVAGGVVSFFVLNKAEAVCTTPTIQPLVLDAIEKLIVAGVVPSIEQASEAIRDAQYVWDPDDQRWEYWLIFEGSIAAELSLGCPLNEETFPLDIQYDGVRQLD